MCTIMYFKSFHVNLDEVSQTYVTKRIKAATKIQNSSFLDAKKTQKIIYVFISSVQSVLPIWMSVYMYAGPSEARKGHHVW